MAGAVAGVCIAGVCIATRGPPHVPLLSALTLSPYTKGELGVLRVACLFS